MKLKLFLFLCFACTLLAGRAMAQGCHTTAVPFGNHDVQVPPGTCWANSDPDSPTGQGGRLRWDDNGSHELVLFDSEHGGNFLWCAGGAGNPNNCAVGNTLCLQADGNIVIYEQSGTCSGTPVWASNTQQDNDGQELLLIEENVFFGGVLRTGERVVIRNGSGLKFVSTGYTDNDPS